MEITRIFDLLDWMVLNYPREDALAGKRNGVWEKYSTADYYKYAHLLAYGLYEMGVTKGDRILTVSNNRPEWNFLDMAIGMLGAVHVPVYPTLNTEGFQYIFEHCQAKFLFVGTSLLYRRVQPACQKMAVSPEIFSIDSINGVRNISEILDLGIATRTKNEPQVTALKKSIEPDDLFSIVYTSGTTGASKGVMLSHRNFIFNFVGHSKVQIIDEHCKMLSFLPLNHIFERSMVYEYQYLGASVYYAEGIGTIQSNLAEIHGDGFCSVPRVIETIYDKLFSAGKQLPWLSRVIYYGAIKHGYKYDWNTRNPLFHMSHWFYDGLVYRKWRARFGGHRLTIVSGGSAIQPRIIRLFSAAGLEIYEGYGMTETSPVIAVNNPHDGFVRIGTVGRKLEGTELSFSDEGEILTRGPHVMLGYYKDPEYTDQVIDAEGWLHTGDIGELVDGMYLKITDRKKEIFKLSAGKYVAPQLIENLIKGSSYIEQAMVIGENEKFASALIVPNFPQLREWADRNHVSYQDNSDLVHNQLVYVHFQKIIDEFNHQLAPHEQLKRFRLVPHDWTMQNGFLSPTLKLRRSVLAKEYKDVIDEIYLKSERPAGGGQVFRQDLSHISFDSLEKINRPRLVIPLDKAERQKNREMRRSRRAARRAERQVRRTERLTRKANRLEFRLQRRAARINRRMMRRIARRERRQLRRQLKQQGK